METEPDVTVPVVSSLPPYNWTMSAVTASVSSHETLTIRRVSFGSHMDRFTYDWIVTNHMIVPKAEKERIVRTYWVHPTPAWRWTRPEYQDLYEDLHMIVNPECWCNDDE